MTTMSRYWGVIVLFVLISFCLSLVVTGMFGPAYMNNAVAQEKSAAKKKVADYLIGAGDVLEIVVWREDDISRIVRVRPDGKISLPLVDDIQAAEGTLGQLKDRLTKALADFVDAPSVYVMLQENRSKRFYVVGRVNAPGEYILERDITVLQAIAAAKGFTEWAKKDDIVIVRDGPRGQVVIEFNYDRVISGKDATQNIVLKPDDVIVVP